MWSVGARERKKEHFLYRLFYLFLTFVFYLDVQCIEYTFRIYILLLIKKRYLIHFYCFFLKLSKAFSASLVWRIFAHKLRNRKIKIKQLPFVCSYENTLYDWLVVQNCPKLVHPKKISRLIITSMLEKYLKVSSCRFRRYFYEMLRCCYYKPCVCWIFKHLFFSFTQKLYLFKNRLCFRIMLLSFPPGMRS